MFSGCYFPVCLRLVTAAVETPEDLSWLRRVGESTLCTSGLKICACVALVFCIFQLCDFIYFFFLMISPGIAASAVSSLNLHFTEFKKISLAWVKVNSASHMSL